MKIQIYAVVIFIGGVLIGGVSVHIFLNEYATPYSLNEESTTHFFGEMHHVSRDSDMRSSTQNINSSVGMLGAMDHTMMMVKSEREFLEGMIPHHQEAVDTAKEVIARGGSTSEIKKLAEDIVVAQEKEITMMKEWYQNWYSEAHMADRADYKPMMRGLSNLSGAALDKVFLEDMIMHHMGAVMMAQSVQSHIEHTEMTELTKAIMETQTDEIQLMQRMLTEFQ
jgi:uncharacterized protein (DUF305 family)